MGSDAGATVEFKISDDLDDRALVPKQSAVHLFLSFLYCRCCDDGQLECSTSSLATATNLRPWFPILKGTVGCP